MQKTEGCRGGKRTKRMLRLLLSAALLTPYSAFAAETMSLRQAWERAMHHDAQYLASEADTQISKEEVSKAAAAFKPNLKASTSRGRNQTDHSDLYGEDPTVWYNTLSHSLSLRQPLLNLPGIATWKQAKAIRAKSESLFRSEHSSLIVRTAEVYCNALLAEENIALTKAQVDATKGQLEQARKRYANGFGTITEVSEAQASYDLALADQADAAAGLENSHRELERITGVYDVNLCRLEASRMALRVPEPGNVEEWVALAKEKSGRIGAARQEVEIARKEIDRNKASRYPQLDLWAGRSYSVSENNYTIGSTYDTWSLSLQLSMQIYSGGYTSASVRQARARKLKAGEELNRQERESIVDVRRYYQAQINSITQVKAFEQAVKSGEVALEGTRKGFMAGFRTNTEVLDAMKKLLETRRSLAKARYQYLLNSLMLRDAAGILSESDLDEADRFFVPAGS